MNLVELDHALRKLRLSGMADVLEARLRQAQSERQTPIDLVSALKAAVERHGLAATVEVKVTGCHGFCEKGPIVVVRPENIFYVMVKAADADELDETTEEEEKG